MDLNSATRPAPLVPTKRKRASPTVSMAMEDYKEEMRFYYIGLGYTIKEVRNAMESYHNLGASLVQYRERLNKWGFKKRGTKKQWETIAQSVAVRGIKKESEAVINGEHLISSTRVRRAIARKFTLSEISRMGNNKMHQGDSTPNLVSSTPRAVEVRSPLADPLSWSIFTWCIPRELLNSLPIRISDPKIIQICKGSFLTLQRQGILVEEEFLIKSRRFKDLRLLLYRLSNRLFDFEIIRRVLGRLKSEDGYRTLKELISLDTISVKAACSSLLLISGIQLDSQLVQLIYQKYPNLTSAWVHKLNQMGHYPTAEGIDGGLNNLMETAFLRNLGQIRSFPTLNANALRFLRCCFRDIGTWKLHRNDIPIAQQFWSLGSGLDAPPISNNALLGAPARTYSLNRSLRFDCRISINLLILRALVLGWIGDVRLLLYSVIHIPSDKIKGKAAGLSVSNTRDLRDWFWAELSPFLDAYLAPRHLCHLLCALIFTGQTNLSGLLLQYIQKCRTLNEKDQMGVDIKNMAFAGYWITGSFRIYAATAPIRTSETLTEDSLTIFCSKKLGPPGLDSRVRILRAFGNFLSSRVTFTRIYLQDKMPHLVESLGKQYEFTRCSDPNSSSLELDGFEFRVAHNCSNQKDPNGRDELDLFDLPILVLSSGRKVLISLLSPWEENNNIFDSLFWLSTKSCYRTCSGCSCRCNVKADLWGYDQLDLSLSTVRMFMCEVFAGGLHDIRKLDGKITLWDSAGRLPGQSYRRRWPLHRPQDPVMGPGPGFQRIFESFGWEKIFRDEYGKSPMMLRSKNYNMEIMKSLSFRKNLPHIDWKIVMHRGSERERGIMEYLFDFLESEARDVDGAKLYPSENGTKVIKRILQDFKPDIDRPATDDGQIPNSRRGRTLLQVVADWFNNVKVLQILINHGANVNAPGPGDFGTALQSCCRRPTATTAPGMTRINSVRLLVEAGAYINPRNLDGTRPQFTPLDGAVLTGDLAVARYLLEREATIDMDTIRYAIMYGRLDMVSLLVQCDPKFYDPALNLARRYEEELIEEYLEGRYLGQELQGVPSEFVRFSRMDETEG
ncbi:hypothetical protein TWF730_000907 [Orbilia blumenaviensis]|uniref:Clr5 domain-containing protein n=1 Tax=Orbilia blumenaviensis TaxID=1796055 RepID=A0AAV9VQQ0_9PEZI